MQKAHEVDPFVPVRGVRREAMLDDRILQQEVDAVLRNAWHLVGHRSEFPNAGDYQVARLGNEEVVVLRDDKGMFRAFHNFCPHRGHPLCQERKGNIRGGLIMCPYHAWTFSARDGLCRTAPHMPKDFDRESHFLVPASVYEGEGFIFVGFGDQPHAVPALAEVGFDGYDMRRVRIVAEKTWMTKANWHIVSENNMECYHCALNHPSLCRVHDPFDDFASDETLLAGGQDALRSIDPTMTTFGSTKKTTVKYMWDNQVVCRLPLPRTNDEPARARNLFVQPGAIVTIGEDAGFLQWWRPISATLTEQVVKWFVHEDATDAQIDLQALMELEIVTMDEDAGLCEQVQRGISSSHYKPGILNRNFQSGGILHYRYMAAHMGDDILA